MENDIINENHHQADEPIVIADECGDSMWDAVLRQKVKACQIFEPVHNPDTLINKIDNVLSVETSGAK